MKVNKEIIEKTIKEEKITYIACDGMEFSDEEQCKEYEKSAKCAITTMYKELVVGQTNQDNLFWGSPDEYVDIVKIQNEEDIKTVLMYEKMRDPSISQSTVVTKKDIGKEIMIGWDYNREYDWRIGSIDELIERIQNHYNERLENPGTIDVW